MRNVYESFALELCHDIFFFEIHHTTATQVPSLLLGHDEYSVYERGMCWRQDFRHLGCIPC